MTVKRIPLIVSLVLMLAFSALTFSRAIADPPVFFKGFSKAVEADPNKEYRLTETNGPVMILVTAFSGSNGRQDANALVLDLRKNYKFKAYVHEQVFEHDFKKEAKKPQSPYAGSAQQYRKTGSRTSYAVLVGDFQSLDDRDFQNALKGIKQCNPDSIKGTSQDYKNWRRNAAIVNSKGPLYMAFGVTNPLAPPETQRGTVDKLVEAWNSDSLYSLLKCPRHYTVQIATFTGKVIIRQDEITEIEAGHKPFTNNKISELDLAQKAATKLCKVLREQGVEAYEFHDHFASIVTVGSFDSIGQELPNGMIELNPEVASIMKRFQGKPAQNGVQPGITVSHEPVRIANIECDIQPQPIEVPRKAPRR